MEQEKIEAIKKKVSRTSIHISRIPEKVKTEFIELSNEDFEGDYGMCIKWLMDFRSGILSSPNEELSAKIDILADEIKEMKKKNEDKPPAEIRMVGGKVLNRRNEK